MYRPLIRLPKNYRPRSDPLKNADPDKIPPYKIPSDPLDPHNNMTDLFWM